VQVSQRFKLPINGWSFSIDKKPPLAALAYDRFDKRSFSTHSMTALYSTTLTSNSTTSRTGAVEQLVLTLYETAPVFPELKNRVTARSSPQNPRA
jgi:hypothetical protein